MQSKKANLKIFAQLPSKFISALFLIVKYLKMLNDLLFLLGLFLVY